MIFIKNKQIKLIAKEFFEAKAATFVRRFQITA